jgi:hypothetical protein
MWGGICDARTGMTLWHTSVAHLFHVFLKVSESLLPFGLAGIPCPAWLGFETSFTLGGKAAPGAENPLCVNQWN